MKIFNINAVRLLVVVVIVASFAACKKSNGFDSKRQTIVRIKDAEKAITVLARDVTPTIETFQLADVRRDADNEAGLNQTVTVTIANQQSVIDDYNTENGTSFELLPANSYTLSEDLSNLVFGPGDFAKAIMITLDKSQLDLSKQYALGLTITNVGDGAVASNAYNTAVYSVGVKNKYDGKYTVTAVNPMVDFSNSGLTGNYPWEVELRTSGPNSVLVYDVENDYLLHPILSGPDWSYYGSFAMEFTFDPATNAVVSVTNPYGQPSGNGRSAELDPSGVNKWNTNLQVKYWMNQPSVITPHRVSFDELFTYTGPR